MIHIRVYPMAVAPGHQTSYFTSVVVLLVLLDIDNWGVMTQIEPNTHMLVYALVKYMSRNWVEQTHFTNGLWAHNQHFEKIIWVDALSLNFLHFSKHSVSYVPFLFERCRHGLTVATHVYYESESNVCFFRYFDKNKNLIASSW